MLAGLPFTIAEDFLAGAVHEQVQGDNLFDKHRRLPRRCSSGAIEALRDNGYGQYDGLIAILTPALGADGLAHLKSRVEALAATPMRISCL